MTNQPCPAGSVGALPDSQETLIFFADSPFATRPTGIAGGSAGGALMMMTAPATVSATGVSVPVGVVAVTGSGMSVPRRVVSGTGAGTVSADGSLAGGVTA